MNEKLKSAAATCFFANPTDKLYHVTADGQCFNSWHDANEHSKYLGVRELVEISRRDCEGLDKNTEGKKTLLEQIDACTKAEEVEALIKNNTPKATKEIAAAKIESLKANA